VGVPGLNKVKVQLEQQQRQQQHGKKQQQQQSSILIVSRSDLGSLVSRDELEAKPFVVVEPEPPPPPQDADEDDRFHRTSGNEKTKEREEQKRKKKKSRDYDTDDNDDNDSSNKQIRKRSREEVEEEDSKQRRRRSDSGGSASDDDSARRTRRDKKRKKETKKERRRTDERRHHRDDHHQESDDAWLMPHIRVRVVTTKLGQQHYQQKGVVVDVTPKGATLRMDDAAGSILDNVSARHVTTALPKVQGCAVVVQGKHKGARGVVLQRDANQAVLQLHEDHTVLTLSLDDLAEWCGPRDDDEY
jgi:G patch domain/KOW motif-containing protein